MLVNLNLKTYLCGINKSVKKNITMATTITNQGYAKFVGQTNTTRGAQHGRGSSLLPRPTDKKIYTKYVPLTDGYDRGGAYWGIGSPLYLEFTVDLTWWCFVRK